MLCGAIMSCLWSHSNSLFEGFYSAYATNLGDAWYGLLPGSCKENIPLKQPIPLNTYLSCFVFAVLFQYLPSYHHLGQELEGISLMC